ncbi:MAG: phosphotransferase family protein [Acidimicrobiia bacterium]|nr:phosphotransferase family protein [Acidimicrobiia bacterium]MCY4435079.1 phosphotransferase family protein [bacterium]
MDLSPAAVGRAVSEVFDGVDALPRIERLDRGFSWVTLGVDDVIVRVAPLGGTLDPYDPQVEEANLRRVEGIVPAPQVLAVQADALNPIGRPFGVHTRVPGRVLRLTEVTESRPQYISAAAQALGKLHSLAAPKTVAEAYDAELDRTETVYRRAAPDRHPEFEAALAWLRGHRPDCDETAVWCHGDFRFANMSWTGPGELGGILDWERAWAGDPMCDVAFTHRFSGWCTIEDSADYGHPIDQERLAYAARFERVRSFTASMRSIRAWLDGRSNDHRLLTIGRRGEQAMKTELDWAKP